jgi:hypothetical protein
VFRWRGVTPGSRREQGEKNRAVQERGASAPRCGQMVPL